MRISVSPKLLRWARERAGLEVAALEKRFPKIQLWETGDLAPTLKQLEAFSKAVHVPVGMLFLDEPPDEQLPLPDFRTMGAARLGRPSPDLLETIYLCQQRQEWYRSYARMHGEPLLSFVGSVAVQDDPVEVAANIRRLIGFDLEERQALPTWTEALRRFVEQAEESGVLVMVSGIVGNNTRRKLYPEEFRGFALADDFAPLIFINGADTKAAQMFTLAHELAHIWIGESGVSDAQASVIPEGSIERWCNATAAELLVPLAQVHQALTAAPELPEDMQRLARWFKVSALVILRRLFDAGFINRETFQDEYHRELLRLQQFEVRGGGGGDFYRTLGARVGKRFARALVGSALEGQTLFRDAFQMLGIKKSATFYEAARRLGV